MSENAIKSINIPEKVLMEVVQYLSTCPYNQVNNLINGLSIAIKNNIQNQQPQEEKKPFKHPAEVKRKK